MMMMIEEKTKIMIIMIEMIAVAGRAMTIFNNR